MELRSCASCYYSHVCACEDVCSEYTPVGEDAERDYLEELIEYEREEFLREWFRYLSGFRR